VNGVVLLLKVGDAMPVPVDAKWITQTEEKLGVRCTERNNRSAARRDRVKIPKSSA
jgi:hypothetical protein